MLSKSSFKNDLLQYPVTNSADREIIKRWKRDVDVENLWQTITKSTLCIEPADLIKAVLKARRTAQASVNRMHGSPNIKGRYPAKFPGHQDEWAFLKEKISAKVSRENIVTLQAALDLHLRWFDQDSDPPDMSAKDQGGTRVHRLFWEILGEYLRAKLGRRFDKEVATLTEIAFDLPAGTISPTQIADARKQRAH
jgi:hypothetical protein